MCNIIVNVFDGSFEGCAGMSLFVRHTNTDRKMMILGGNKHVFIELKLNDNNPKRYLVRNAFNQKNF